MPVLCPLLIFSSSLSLLPACGLFVDLSLCRSMTRGELTTTTSSSVPSYPCWPRKVSCAHGAEDLASAGGAALSVMEQQTRLGAQANAQSGEPPVSAFSFQFVVPLLFFERERQGCRAARAVAALQAVCVLSLQACWPVWWSRTSRCAGGRESASAACTSRGNPTAGNAPAPTKPSASNCRGAKQRETAAGLWALPLASMLPFAQGRGTAGTSPQPRWSLGTKGNRVFLCA